MDFVEWTHEVLRGLIENRHDPYTGDIELASILFGKDYAHSNEFWGSNHRTAIFDATRNLVRLGLVDENSNHWQVNRNGRLFYENPIADWQHICEQVFDEEESQVLRLVNRFSPQMESQPPCLWLTELERTRFSDEFGLVFPPGSNEERENVNKFLYSIPQTLASAGFIQEDPRAGYYNNVQATYAGLVWETRRGFTFESQFIDELVKEWETTSVDFKRELNLNTRDGKGEFAKDVLGLVNTKASGRRWMIVGFDDKTRKYHAPPDSNITQDRIEQILSNLTEPMVNTRYEVIDYRLGKVGRLEVIRETFKLPYRAADDVVGASNKRRLEKGAVYVRHGTHTEVAVGNELLSLEEEGSLANSEASE